MMTVTLRAAPGQTPASCRALADDLRRRAAHQAARLPGASTAQRAAAQRLIDQFTADAERWERVAGLLERETVRA